MYFLDSLQTVRSLQAVNDVLEGKVIREDGLREGEAGIFIEVRWFDQLAGNAVKVSGIIADLHKISLVERVLS